MHVCTVVAPGDLAWAQALVDDVLRLHPGSDVTVLVVDEVREGSEPVVLRGAEVLFPADLPALPLARMALVYDLRELAAALTPWLMRALIDRGLDHIVHLDPQLLLLRPLEGLEALCLERSVVLVARRPAPLPRDGRRPDEQDVLLTGMYDRALVGVGGTPEGRAMLDWWVERVSTEAFDEPAAGLHLDQRWLDLVPGTFRHSVITDPTWNVGELALPGRDLTRSDDGAVLVDGDPVTFVNLRGYSVETPHLLRADPEGPVRVLLSDQPVLRQLTDERRHLVLGSALGAASGTTPRREPFSEHDGVALDPVVRRLVRAEVARTARGARPRPGPWDVPLKAWLSTPDEESPVQSVGRYLAEVYRSRSDLQAAFPEVVRGQPKRFSGWVRTFGTRELGPALAALASGEPETVVDRAPLLSRRLSGPRGTRSVPGVEVVGYLSAELGQGESARQFVAGLELAGVPVGTSTYTRLSSRLGVPWADRVPDAGTRLDTVLMCVSPEALPELVQDLGPAALKDRYRIGLWFWELTDFPARLRPSLDLVDEIWVASQFNATTLRAVTDKPVVVMPHPAHPPAVSGAPVAEVPPSDVPTFLFVFDYLSILERKNPMRTVEAFVRAFPEPGSARLVIKSVNGEKKQVDRERLRYQVSGRDDIVLIERYLDRVELDALMHGADCYVSLHRSEGFGQTLAEMMAIGKPVIATAYSGNLEFTRPDNSFLVPATMTPVPPGNDPYLPPAEWADPDLDASVAAMRQVVADRAEAARRAARARSTIAEEFSVPALSAALTARLDVVASERDGDGAGTSVGAETPAPGASTDAVAPLSRRLRQRFRRSAT